MSLSFSEFSYEGYDGRYERDAHHPDYYQSDASAGPQTAVIYNQR